MLVAITRGVSDTLGACELTHLPRVDINLELAREQHQRYEDALRRAGCQVVSLPPLHDLPDAVFVEDVAIVLDELAIVTRPGAGSRRPEIASVSAALRTYRTVVQIEEPGTLDGGDVLRLGTRIYVGLSGRSNAAAIEQLRVLTRPYGYTVEGVAVSGCLHLKSAVSEVAPSTILVNPVWVDPGVFGDVEVVDVDPSEPYAANGLLVCVVQGVSPAGSGPDIVQGFRPAASGRDAAPGFPALPALSEAEGSEVPGSTGRVEGIPASHVTIYPASFPRTRRTLEARGIPLDIVDVSELQKAEGAVTCCSLILAGFPAVISRDSHPGGRAAS